MWKKKNQLHIKHYLVFQSNKILERTLFATFYTCTSFHSKSINMWFQCIKDFLNVRHSHLRWIKSLIEQFSGATLSLPFENIWTDFSWGELAILQHRIYQTSYSLGNSTILPDCWRISHLQVVSFCHASCTYNSGFLSFLPASDQNLWRHTFAKYFIVGTEEQILMFTFGS